MVRSVGGVVAGIVIFFALLVLLELVAHQVAPTSGATLLYAIVVFAYFVSALAGGLTAGLIAERVWAAWAIAVLVLLCVIWTIADLPQPLWVQVASVIAPLVAGFFAAHFVRSRVARRPGGPLRA
jgi:hypothetical protein